MSKIQFRLAARTDAAGKYNATAPLEGNEDNMFIDADLSNMEQGVFMADEVVDLSDKGCLMVVADGMGGMNAGEVASAIAIKTVMEYFDAQHMAVKSFRDSRSRMNYMEEVVVAADAAIKADANMDKNHEGMGSTIIMAWLCDGEICLTWCGDSRAYLYRPGCGFWQVSKDHSYVQGLVDEGKITPDEAFDHPYGNIITRSLGDPEKKAKADSVNFDVYKGDIFMLCSDGLSGVLRDHKTFDENGQRIDTENLEDIIAANRTSMAQCRDELFDAAQRNDWYDNVTAILCEIVGGNPIPADMKPPVQAASQPRLEQSNYTPQAPNPVQANNIRSSRISIRKKNLPIFIAAVVLLIGGAGFLVWWIMQGKRPTDEKEFFDYCEKSQKVEDYRAFVKQFPNSTWVPFAQNKIKEFEQDSIKKLQQQKQGEEPPQPPVKDEEKVKKGGKEPNVKQLPTSTIGESISEKLGKTNSQEDPEKNDLTPVGDKGLKKIPTEEKPKEEKPKEEKPKVSNNAEEAFMECLKINTVEALADWMDKYGDRKTRDEALWKQAIQQFGKLYRARAKSCDTKEKCNDFLNNHEKIMKKSRMLGTQVDIETSRIVNDKLKELEKEENGGSSSSRPGTGVQNAPTIVKPKRP